MTADPVEEAFNQVGGDDAIDSQVIGRPRNPQPDPDSSSSLPVSPLQHIKLRRQFLAARRRQTRSAPEKSDISLIYPAEQMLLNPRSRLDPEEEANLIPELPKEKGINYVFPFSPAFRRDQRQTSPFTQEPTTASSSRPTSTTAEPVSSTTEEAAANHIGDEKDEEEIVSVSVSKSVSESFSVGRFFDNLVEAVTSTLAPTVVVPLEEKEPVQETTTKKEEKVTKAPPPRVHPLFANKRINRVNAPKLHPILAVKSSPEKSSVTTSAPSVTRRHPFFKQRTASTVEETSTTEIPASEIEDDDEEGSGEDIENDEDEVVETTTVTPETTTKRNSLAQKIQERLQKEAQKKKEALLEKSLGAKPTASSRINFLGNRDARPKFQVPSSLKSRLEAKAKESSHEAPENNKTDAESTTTRTSLRATSRFRPTFRNSRTTPTPRFSSRQTSLASGAPTADPTTQPTRRTTNSLSRFRSRSRPLDLSPLPSQNVLSRGRTRTRTTAEVPRPEVTTQASTTTTKLTVAAILADLHGESPVDEAPVTLRPKSFKPKFGSRQKDKVRERLREQLENQEKEELTGVETGTASDEEGREIETFEVEDVQPQPAVATTGRRRTIQRTRTRPRVSSLTESPRSSAPSASPPSLPVQSLRSNRLRSRPRLVKNTQRGRGDLTSGVRRPITRFSQQQPLLPQPSGEKVDVNEKHKNVLSDDIMAGLGLSSGNSEVVANEDHGKQDVNAVEAPPNGEALLIQLVKNNQQKSTEAESVKPIMEDASLIPAPAIPESITEEEVPPSAPFNPQDFLRTAVVESKIPPDVLESPVAPVPEVPLVLMRQENSESVPAPEEETEVAELEDVAVVESPRSRVRSRHRLPRPSSVVRNEILEVDDVSENQQQVVNTRRSRIRNRGRVSQRNQDPAGTTATSQEPSVTRAPASRPKARSRSRARLSSSRGRGTATPSKSEDNADDSKAEKASDELVPLSQTAFGTRRTNLGTSSRVNNRLRVRQRARTGAVPPETDEESSDQVEPEDQPSSSTSTGGNVSRRTNLRTRSRFVGKSRTRPAAAAEGESAITRTTITTTTSPVVSDDSLLEVSTEQPPNALDQIVDDAEDKKEEKVKPLRPGTFRPQFGEKQRQSVRERLQAKVKEDTEQSNKVSSPEPMETTTEAFKAVSPQSGITALPANFFTSPKPYFSSFPAKSAEGEDEVTPSERITRPSGQSERVERSTTSFGLVLTTQDYNKIGVSGHAFKDVPVATTASTPGASEEENNQTETPIKPNKKVKISKGLFGRKRPNFLSALKKANKKDRKSSQFGRVVNKISGSTAKNEVTKKAAPVTTTTAPLISVSTVRSTGGFSLRPFKRPRRRLDVKSLKSLFSGIKEDKAKSEGDEDLKEVVDVSTTPVPSFEPTPVSSVDEKKGGERISLTEAPANDNSVAAGLSDDDTKSTKGTSRQVPKPRAGLRSSIKSIADLKAKLLGTGNRKNKFSRYGRKSKGRIPSASSSPTTTTSSPSTFSPTPSSSPTSSPTSSSSSKALQVAFWRRSGLQREKKRFKDST